MSIKESLKHRRRLARSVEIGPLQDAFLVSAVVMILVIRLQLWATNYPQLGSGKLHIAHLLWGGLFMLIAVGLLISFVGRGVRLPAAIVGGIGFGFFIDELGKFITSDTDYFYKPAAGIIYLIFIGLYLLTRWMQRHRGLSQRESLVNAIDALTEAARGDLNERDKERIMELLSRADPHNPLTRQLRELCSGLEAVPTPQANPATRIALAIRNRYEQLVEKPRFATVITVVFGVWAFVTTITIVLLSIAAALKLGGVSGLNLEVGRDNNITFTDVAAAASGLVSGILAIWGIVRLRRGRRLDAYWMFERALLVEIFIGDFFSFLELQFTAVFGLAISILLLITVRYMVRGEQELERRRSMDARPGEPGHPAPAGERLAPA